MAYRCSQPNEKAGDYDFRLMEVVMVKKTPAGDQSATQVVIVDNHFETLRFVQENMDNFINNIIGVRKMATSKEIKVEESARLFEKNLEPLFEIMSRTSQNNLLDKFSVSLRKALILMAMERYKADKDSVCKALGISRAKLDQEMACCGL